MHVTVHYLAQLRQAASRPFESIELSPGVALADLLDRLAERPRLRPLLSEPSLLVFVGDEQVDSSRRLCDGDRVTILSPMAGG